MQATTDPEAPRIPKRLFKKRWLTAGAVAALALGLWLAREPIADRFIRDELDGRGIPARYTIEEIGFRTERLSDVVIGDPARPDLTAKIVEVSLGYGLSGPYISEIRADGVRLYGRFVEGQLSLGTLDKFRDPADKTPFALPDISVVLADARARVETPWGDVGAVLNGGGNLRNNFTGKLALVAPVMDAAGCSGEELSFYGDVRVRNVRPTLTGPLRGSRLVCGNGSVAVDSPQIALDVSLAETLQSWRGTADASLAKLKAGPVSATKLGLLARFSGSAARTTLDGSAEIAELSAADFSARRVELSAKAEVGHGSPQAEGEIRFVEASASPELRRSMTASAARLDASPLGPLAAKAAAALSRMLAEVSGGSAFALTGEGRAVQFELFAPQFRSASGASVAGSAESRIAWLPAVPGPRMTIAGDWTFGGGGLPSGSLALDRRADGTTRGEARFAPYAAGSARLALDPVRFSSAQKEKLRFATRATLSGPLADGRVERLTVPLAGTIASNGEVTFAGGCTRVGIDRLAASGFRIARAGIDLCSRPGAPLLSAGPAGLRGTVLTRGIALRGTSGSSPFAFDARRGEIDLSAMRWMLTGTEVRLGESESVTRFAADRISGHGTSGGMQGKLSGASGKIGAVPLVLSDIAGNWRGQDGTLTLDGSLGLSDAEPDPRFFPLVSDIATLRYAKGGIDAAASFRERKSGRKILDAVIHHDLEPGTGFADLDVPEIRFDEGFQPDQLTRLALGVVANVQGSLVGGGRIEWSPLAVTSHGTFATANTDLAAAFGPVKGLTTTLTFVDLINLRTAPGQIATVAEINPGIPVIDGTIEYRLLGDNRVRIEGGRWPLAGGELVLHPATLDFNASEPRRLSFDIVGVDAAAFLQQFGFENIHATGTFDGTLPVEFDGLGGRIVGGRIDSRGGGGTLAYVGELSNHNLGAIANFAFGALRSLKYDDLTIILNGDLDGEMVTDIRFGGVGQGEGATQNFLTRQIAKLPFVFNVKIQAPFRQLISSAKGFYDPTLVIEQNLPTLLRVQQEVDAAKAGAEPPVQPPESEPVP